MALLYTSRIEIATRFHLILGGWLDGSIQVDIAAHWYNVLAGRERWNETSYFAPARDALGYNDGYLLNGLVAAVFRLAGADELLAFDLSCVVVRAIGFVAFIALARRSLRLRWPTALLGGALFTILDNVFRQEGHAQLISVSMAPLVAWLLWSSVEAQIKERRVRAAIAGCIAAITYGLWLLTAYYMVFFFTLFTALFGLALLGQQLSNRSDRVSLAHGLARWPSVVTGAALLLSTVPFLLVYLPKARETRMHDFAAVVGYLPSVTDIVNVGSTNLFGSFAATVMPAFLRVRFGSGEHVVGLPPLILALAALGILSLSTDRTPRRRLYRAAAFALLLSFALALHLGHFSLWRLVFHSVPGAKGVRVVCRFFLFLGVPIILFAVSYLDSRVGRWPSWLLVGIGALLLVEEINLAPPVHFDRVDELRLLASIPPPPAGCKVFYVRRAFARPTMPGGAIGANYPQNVDAMTLAERWAFPTVNGFSTFLPPLWNFASADQSDYVDRVNRYIQQAGVPGAVCSVDLARRTWASD